MCNKRQACITLTEYAAKNDSTWEGYVYNIGYVRPKHYLMVIVNPKNGIRTIKTVYTPHWYKDDKHIEESKTVYNATHKKINTEQILNETEDIIENINKKRNQNIENIEIAQKEEMLANYDIPTVSSNRSGWSPYNLSGETRLEIFLGSPLLGPLASYANYPDAISIELNVSAGALFSTNTSPIGELFKVNSNIKGPNAQSYFQGSAGFGAVGASANVVITEYFIVGSNAHTITMGKFNGLFGSFDAGADIGIGVGGGVSVSRVSDDAYIIGISYSVGLGVGASLNLTGGYMDFYNKYIQ